MSKHIHYFHVTFATKYRQKILNDLFRDFIEGHLERIRKIDGITVWAYAIDTDHMHLLIEPSKEYSLPVAIRIIKCSLTWNFKKLVKEERLNLWQRGYFSETVSIKNPKQLLDYLNHHDLSLVSVAE